MNGIERFVASLKRLFAPRSAPTPAEPSPSEPAPAVAPAPEPVEVPRSELAPPAATETAPPPMTTAPKLADSTTAAPLDVAPPPIETPVPREEPPASIEAQMPLAVDMAPPLESEPIATDAADAIPETAEVETAASVAPPEVPPATPAGTGGQLLLRLATERTPAPTFEVARTGATLGRGEGNTIRLEDLSVSRKHARITYKQGGYWLSDVGSVSGTWVDGTKLNAPRRIATGQTIDLGLCRLTVESAGEDVASPANGPKRTELAAQGRRRR